MKKVVRRRPRQVVTEYVFDSRLDDPTNLIIRASARFDERGNGYTQVVFDTAV